MASKKILIQVWKPLFEQFDKKIKNACLRRDAYLAKILDLEVNQLKNEVSWVNSDSATQFVSGKFSLLEKKIVTFTLESSLIERINNICRNKGIVRDAFFNRLLFLLTASSNHIDKLFDMPKDWRVELWPEIRNDYFDIVYNPLSNFINPLEILREGLKETKSEVGIYTKFFSLNEKLTGLNVYVNDYDLPNSTLAEKLDDRSLDQLLDELINKV